MDDVIDPVLRRFRTELAKLYGERIERVVLYGSRARGMHVRIPTMTWRYFSTIMSHPVSVKGPTGSRKSKSISFSTG